MILLDGKSLSEKNLSDLKQKIENSRLKINLDIVLVGDNPSSLKYIALKQKPYLLANSPKFISFFSLNGVTNATPTPFKFNICFY